jgi:hypothetical protein
MGIIKEILSNRNINDTHFLIFKCAFNFSVEKNRSAETGKKIRTKTAETTDGK